MKVIDVHAHVFPDDVADAYIANYTSHSHLPAVCRPTVEGLVEEYRGIEVERLVLLQEWESTIQFSSENLKLMAESDRYYTKCYFYSYNRWLGLTQKGRKDVICFGGVHPDEPDRLEEFERMVGEYGLSGLKLPQCMQHFFVNDRRLFPIYERAQSLGIPALFHTGGDPIPGMELYGHPRDVRDVARAFPSLTIIMAHVGIPFFEEAKEVLQRHRNVHTDISYFIEYMDPAVAVAILDEIGYERILFGSDFPFVKPKNAIEKVLRLKIDDKKKAMILSENARAVLSLST
jgi:predicted TIM-barrel fold metal-dependent hydrolase